METGNRGIYIAVILLLACFFFFFSKPYLLCALLLILLLAVYLAFFIRTDAKKLSIKLDAGAGGQTEQQLPVSITVERSGVLLAAGYISFDIEIKNVLFGSTEHVSYRVPVTNSESETFRTSIVPKQCGQLIFRCTEARISDVLNLFSVKTSGFKEVHTTIYPHDINIELNISHRTVGAASTEDMIQNRKGNDPSEIFDLREYIPGDDIRAIHWKLSVKTDKIMLRQASDPMHYDVVLMPDLGLSGTNGICSVDELNSAAALTTSIGEQLLRQNVKLCLAVPSPNGLGLFEVKDLRSFYSLLPQWLAITVCEHTGTGLSLFTSEHMENYFTRIIIVSAGKYDQELSILHNGIGITVVSAVDNIGEPVYANIGSLCDIAEIPSNPEPGASFRIIC